MRLVAPALAAVLLATAADAQSARVLADDPWCEEVWASDDRAVVCEVRETLLRTDALDVRAVNGEVSVREWDRPDVLVRARVTAVSADAALARRQVRATTVTTAAGRVRSSAPSEARSNASVSYQVFAPRSTRLTVAALNGPVSIEGMAGRIRAEVTNGPVALAAVGGDVEVDATNGPVSVALSGTTWRGAGLTVRAMNGPIQLTVPGGYGARLSARTHQGRISAPDLRTGARERRRDQPGDRLDATLGSGGPVLSLVAHNGPVQIRTGG
ncbi:hypothetical protein [Rubrivirga sp.]|uniref:hypothetical protein n=1 Tax=Rubrivirga sp. TaxID=1885344 RepID=UPI003B520FD5